MSRAVHEVRVLDLAVLDGLLELLAGGDVVVPRRPQGGDLRTVGGQARRRELVGAVAHGHAADVGAEADDLTAGGRALLPLPRRPLRLDVAAAVVHPVVELAGLRRELADPALFDRLDVGRTGVGRQVGGEVLVVVLGLRDALGDLHVRVELHVLVVQSLVSELAEGADRQVDLSARGRGVLAAVTAGSGGEQGSGQQRGGYDREAAPGSGAGTCCVHVSPPGEANAG